MAEQISHKDILSTLYPDMINVKIILELANDFSVKNIYETSRTLLNFKYNKFNLDIDFREIIGLFYNRPTICIFKPDIDSLWQLLIYSNNALIYVFELSQNQNEIIYGKNITPSPNMMGLLNNIKMEV